MTTITSNKELFTSLRDMDLDVRVGENIYPVRKEIKDGRVMLAITYDLEKGLRIEDKNNVGIQPDDIKEVIVPINDSVETQTVAANIYKLSLEKFLSIDTIQWLSTDMQSVEKEVVKEDGPDEAKILKFDPFTQACNIDFQVDQEDLDGLDVRQLNIQIFGSTPRPEIYSRDFTNVEDGSCISISIAPHHINSKMDVYVYTPEGIMLGAQTILVSRPINMYPVSFSHGEGDPINVDDVLNGTRSYRMEYELAMEFTTHMIQDMTITSCVPDKLKVSMVGFNVKEENIRFIIEIKKGTDLTELRGKKVPLTLCIDGTTIKDIINLEFF